MRTRMITGAFFGLTMIILVWLGGWPFSLLISVVASIAMVELLRMRNIKALSLEGIAGLLSMWLWFVPEDWFSTVLSIEFTKVEMFAFLILILLMLTVMTKNKFTFDEVGFIVVSSIYVGFGFHYLLLTREIPGDGIWLLFYVLVLIWATDSGAYFIGKAIGKHKLWPHISPNKTIEGAVGGILLAVFVGSVFYMIYPVTPLYITAFCIMLVTSIFGQMGDLVESALKRHYAVKDSGHVLPGHGGILDRFDSLIYVLPILHLLQLIA
ncbi:phosphatidate cytidylyltransferase [Shouchella lonarensis]|uniref:Phosphatidate cytidylyltransferase n=1 Tax=Shouchella lonarensis TaxID=1464122 RepID=A0A1G6H7Q1_9BACI|nr:phosphatidate cytidylyltransferase [Shouchella lonarensis]SDB90174.1 phosphatidate cytidylyltransferase [Shouchella lonarensis]